eukprot:GDKJ01053168.1.p1 GENE.GDKJ01053168.1~~GDKJ01053168.1.p1  ORF type:complete len:148 (-),score=9.72 GDKJ01053168.1:363-806(-)
MEFTKVFEGITNCDCLQDSVVDISNMFVRRIFDENLKMSDFESYHEMGKIPKDNCISICGHRGVSINICTKETKDNLLEKHKKNISDRKKINPEIAIPEFGLVFTFKAEAGKIKKTGKDITHYDFYKSDDFDTATINYLEVVHLASV